jgi:hypothetical protein
MTAVITVREICIIIRILAMSLHTGWIRLPAIMISDSDTMMKVTAMLNPVHGEMCGLNLRVTEQYSGEEVKRKKGYV